MSSAATVPAIQGTVSLDVPVERAFSVFTDSIGTWWPRDYHIGQADMADAIMEPHEGGRWYERGVDGSECDWGRVLAWEPPHRLLDRLVGGQAVYDAIRGGGGWSALLQSFASAAAGAA